jgi:hypothetical protein
MVTNKLMVLLWFYENNHRVLSLMIPWLLLNKGFIFQMSVHKSCYGWVFMFFATHYQSTLSEPRRHQAQNELGQVTNGYFSWITQGMHNDYVWHRLALVISQCVYGAEMSMAAAAVYFSLPSRRGSGRCSAAMDISGTENSSDWAKEFCVRPVFRSEL